MSALTPRRMDGSPFFSGRAKPICAFTRDAIERMAKEKQETTIRDREATLARKRVTAREAADRRRNRLLQDEGPVYVPAPTADCKVLAVAAAMYGVSVRGMLGPNRNRVLTLARVYAVYRLYHELGRSYPQIATLFNRDHTSIMSLLKPRRGRATIKPGGNSGNPSRFASRRHKEQHMTIPTLPVARQSLASISPGYREAVKDLERIAKEQGFGKDYDDAFSVVQREARAAERMLAGRAA